jgi:hypothetical protein
MTKSLKLFKNIFTIIFMIGVSISSGAMAASSHGDLVKLFKDWRAFEIPPMRMGAPDYTAATFAKRHKELSTYQARLNALDTTGWPVADKADWHYIRGEMNGFDFNHRVLKPWARDPAYYKSVWMNKSDVPAHEGPTHHMVTELWTYSFPLSKAEDARLVKDMAIIPPLMKQAQKNLTGNAKELFIAGIRDIRTQRADLAGLAEEVSKKGSAELNAAVMAAEIATTDLINWLVAEAPNKTGPSGIGKENYTWYQQNVHLVPLTWEDEVRLLRRELERAWSSLKLEEHKNRNLPPLKAASSPAEFEALLDKGIADFMSFLKDQDVVTVPDYFYPALEAQRGRYVEEAKRNFFLIGYHLDPKPLLSHFYHWFELAIMEHDPNPNPIRRGAAIYNMYDSRNEGTATAVEEMFMHAGLYDNSPRGREIVWIMIAQRAARGLGSLYAHANIQTMEGAGDIHMNWTPRGWMKTEKELLLFEQHMYMRQPGYGTSYITGKYLLERTMADYAKQKEEQGQEFKLKDFFDQLNAIGGIPISLGRYEMTGLDDDIKLMLENK